MENTYIKVEKNHGVMTIALNRPEVLNSFNGIMAKDLFIKIVQFALSFIIYCLGFFGRRGRDGACGRHCDAGIIFGPFFADRAHRAPNA